MYKKILFLFPLFIFTACNNNSSVNSNLDGEKLAKQKCSMCHNLDMPPTISDKEKAPPLFTITVHLKDWMKSSNPSELKGKFISFVEDYAINPSEDKAYCKKEMLKKYGVMPSQKGNVTKEELRAIANYIFNTYDQMKVLEIMKERARLAKLPLYQQALETNDCKMCHQKDNSRNAPTFQEIGKKYGTQGKEVIKNSILNGSKGKWKGYLLPMRAYKDMPEKYLDALSDWIAKGAKE